MMEKVGAVFLAGGRDMKRAASVGETSGIAKLPRLVHTDDLGSSTTGPAAHTGNGTSSSYRSGKLGIFSVVLRSVFLCLAGSQCLVF